MLVTILNRQTVKYVVQTDWSWIKSILTTGGKSIDICRYTTSCTGFLHRIKRSYVRLSQVFPQKYINMGNAIVLLQDAMPHMSSMDILPGTQPTQYYQSWRLGHGTKHNRPADYCKPQKWCPMRPLTILHPKKWKKLDNQPSARRLILTIVLAWDKVHIPRV